MSIKQETMHQAEIHHLQCVHITVEERKAILAVLRDGLTSAAVNALGLARLLRDLEGTEVYDGAWQYRGLPKAPKLGHYGITGHGAIHTRKL